MMAVAASTSHQLEPAFVLLHMQLVACLLPIASAEQHTSAEPASAVVASSHMSGPAAAYYISAKLHQHMKTLSYAH